MLPQKMKGFCYELQVCDMSCALVGELHKGVNGKTGVLSRKLRLLAGHERKY